MKTWIGCALSVVLFGVGCAADDAALPENGAGGAGGAGGRGSSSLPNMGGSGGNGAVMRPAPARDDGQVIAPWDRYCVATFTSAFEVLDSFNDVKLAIEPGDRYLLGAPGFFDETNIIYVADVGPAEMKLQLRDGSTPPFMSSCGGGATRTYIAVFVDTPVYSDEATTMTSCTLPAGLAVPGDGINYVITNGGGAMSITYQVDLKQLAPHCNGVAKGFVKAARISLGDWSSYAVPIASVLGPSAL